MGSAAGLKDRDQLFGEADEEDGDDRRVGPAHLQTGAGHALGDLRPARTHVAPDQADDTDLDAEQRHGRRPCPS